MSFWSERRSIVKKLPALVLAILLCLTTIVGCNTPQTTQTPDDTNTPEPPEDVIGDYDNENEINTVGKFVAKDKTYAYQGNNVTILKLENQSEVNCSVTIHAKFLSADGTVLKTETQIGRFLDLVAHGNKSKKLVVARNDKQGFALVLG